MSLENRIINQFTDSIQTKQNVLPELCEFIEVASQRMVIALLNDRKIFTCGNGRSASSAEILAMALLNQFERDRPSLPAVSLTANTATLTAIAGDATYDEIYSKQIRSLGVSGDILVIFVDDNHSPNIAKVINVAQNKDIGIIALTGGKNEVISTLLNERDLEIRVQSTSPVRIHEVHILIAHCLCDLIDYQLFDATG